MEKNRLSAEELIQSIKNSMSAKEWKKFCIRYADGNFDTVLWHLKKINNNFLPEDTITVIKQVIANELSDK